VLGVQLRHQPKASGDQLQVRYCRPTSFVWYPCSQVAYASRALAALLNDAHAGAWAAEQFLSEVAAGLRDASSEASSPALYQLLVSALDLPIACKVCTHPREVWAHT
jgi:hypothetical protein